MFSSCGGAPRSISDLLALEWDRLYSEPASQLIGGPSGVSLHKRTHDLAISGPKGVGLQAVPIDVDGPFFRVGPLCQYQSVSFTTWLQAAPEG